MLWPILVTKGRSVYTVESFLNSYGNDDDENNDDDNDNSDDDNNDDDNNDDDACKSLLRPFCISTVVPGTSLLFCSAAGVWPWEQICIAL